MASDVRQDRMRVVPGQIQTKNLTRSQRYSFQETPLELQRPTFQQFSSPTNSTIDESPMSPRRAYTDSLYGVTPVTQMPAQEAPVERTGSPYSFPPPQEVHPAYFAPVDPAPARHMQGQAPASVVAEPLPVKAHEELAPHDAGYDKMSGQTAEAHRKTLAPEISAPPVYNPDSLAGPNGALENHRPGQVSHPNATVDPEWKHGLCSPDALCCFSLLCPCMTYGKTQYRLSKKTQKQDPTDLLGYEACNGSCGVFAVACGFQWIFAMIQRARVRKSYHLEGGLGSDCIKSFCCYCCVVAQNEREVRDREDLIRRNAGPASGAYVTPGTMTYAPPPR